MQIRSIYFLFTVCCVSSCSQSVNEDDRLPNIVILYADDMGYGDLACQNPDSKIPTPNLDQLAAEGIRFTDAHSSSGICTPSRYALLTGRYHWRKFHGIVQSFGPPVFDESRLTLAEMVKQRGYATACIGKWHLGWNWDSIMHPGASLSTIQIKGEDKQVYLPEDFDWSQSISGGPLDQGFDYYFGDDVINFPPYTWIENDRVTEAPTELYTKGREQTPEGSWECRAGPTVAGWDYYKVLPALTKKTIQWIESMEYGKPFLLYVPFPSPHAPIIPNEEFRGKSEAGAYGDFVYQTDWCIGQILDAISRKGLDGNTLVIFTSDNGPENYAYPRVKNHDHYSMGELRGLKRDIWEGGHRVPFIIRWPGNVEGGMTNGTSISQVDIMTTIAEIVGYELGDEDAEDGYSLLPLILPDTKRTYDRSVIVHNTFDGKYAVRKGKWLLIDHKTGNMNRTVPPYFDSIRGYMVHDLPGELYNMETDLSQRINLYSTHQEIVKDLKKTLAEIKAKS